jgi:hypothetical protein
MLYELNFEVTSEGRRIVKKSKSRGLENVVEDDLR